jgi:hypothetical protein
MLLAIRIEKDTRNNRTEMMYEILCKNFDHVFTEMRLIEANL